MIYVKGSLLLLFVIALPTLFPAENCLIEWTKFVKAKKL